MLTRYFSTLRGIRLFMIGFGLIMGSVFPFYSALFFGTRAFAMLYVGGCLAAGFMVGSVCYLIIRQVLRINIERQGKALRDVLGIAGEELAERGGDQLQTTMEMQDGLLGRVERLIMNISSAVERITPLYRNLTDASRGLAEGNAEQVEKVQGTLRAAGEMNESFAGIVEDVENISNRTEDRTSICSEMSSSTDSIAKMVQENDESLLETTGSIEDIGSSLEETSRNVEDLAVSTEQTVTSVNQISASIANVRDNAGKTADFSRKVQSECQEGLRATESLLGAMKDIDDSSRESFEAIQRLTRHSAKIGSFLEVITDIVEQTNLLSLNASIIAAQAGEKGRSFAVVAEEVRSLAERTSKSTREIATLVEDVQGETSAVEKTIRRGTGLVEQGVEASRQTDAVLRKIEESTGAASDMVQKIAEATVEQASGSNMISQEAEKNLERFNRIREAIQTQDKRTRLIVSSLGQMKDLSKRINKATQEQSRGNRQYLNSVMEDNEKAQGLKEMATTQMRTAEEVFAFLEQAASLIEANAGEALRIKEDVVTVSGLSDALSSEMKMFRDGPDANGVQGGILYSPRQEK